MPATSLDLLKAHLNIDHSFDDDLLTHKLETAEAWIANHIGSSFTFRIPPAAPMTEAALQLAAYWYGQRESASSEKHYDVPWGVRELLSSYRNSVTGYAR